jgi:hypothetical protein
MTSHRHRFLAAIPVALCLALSTSTGALAQTAGDTKADYPATAAVAKIADTPGDVATGARWTALARQYSSHEAKIGDTPADFAQPVAPAAKAGDTPADDPGASRAPQYDPPTTITVNRPERTIVRNVDDALATVLAGLALLVALATAGFVLIRTRSMTHASSGARADRRRAKRQRSSRTTPQGERNVRA